MGNKARAQQNSVLAISFDLDGTMYRLRKMRILWRLRGDRRLLLRMLAAREKMRREPALPDFEAFEAREAALVAASSGLDKAAAVEDLRRLRGLMPRALTRNALPYPGLRRVLVEASASRGLKLAVLSDFDPKEKLALLGLDDLPFSALFGADHSGALKPHPRSFQRLSESLNVAPQAVVHIGDREDADVAGAIAAGMRAWLFAPKGVSKSRAEYVVRRWSTAIFERL